MSRTASRTPRWSDWERVHDIRRWSDWSVHDIRRHQDVSRWLNSVALTHAAVPAPNADPAVTALTAADGSTSRLSERIEFSSIDCKISAGELKKSTVWYGTGSAGTAPTTIAAAYAVTNPTQSPSAAPKRIANNQRGTNVYSRHHAIPRSSS